mmetsp:Transcript_20053/g.64064  ORF Transcript_20053/g.64064 Transcript_20053/m.64064 type:complete len:401 (+) Transcript_20053:152-1354(+)
MRRLCPRAGDARVPGGERRRPARDDDAGGERELQAVPPQLARRPDLLVPSLLACRRTRRGARVHLRRHRDRGAGCDAARRTGGPSDVGARRHPRAQRFGGGGCRAVRGRLRSAPDQLAARHGPRLLHATGPRGRRFARRARRLPLAGPNATLAAGAAAPAGVGARERRSRHRWRGAATRRPDRPRPGEPHVPRGRADQPRSGRLPRHIRRPARPARGGARAARRRGAVCRAADARLHHGRLHSAVGQRRCSDDSRAAERRRGFAARGVGSDAGGAAPRARRARRNRLLSRRKVDDRPRRHPPRAAPGARAGARRAHGGDGGGARRRRRAAVGAAGGGGQGLARQCGACPRTADAGAGPRARDAASRASCAGGSLLCATQRCGGGHLSDRAGGRALGGAAR